MTDFFLCRYHLLNGSSRDNCLRMRIHSLYSLVFGRQNLKISPKSYTFVGTQMNHNWTPLQFIVVIPPSQARVASILKILELPRHLLPCP